MSVMQCLICKNCKLSEDFPVKVSDSCNHVPKVCLHCLEKRLSTTTNENIPICPQCGAKMNASRKHEIKAQLSFLQCKVLKELAEQSAYQEVLDSTDQPSSGSVTIAQLDGRSFELQITRSTSFTELRDQIAKLSGVATKDQRLMYNGRRLELDGGTGGRWSDLKIGFGSILHLIVVMLSVTGSKVQGGSLKFTLTWTPTMRADNPSKIKQLHGICSIHSDTGEEIDIAFFENVNTMQGSIVHSGGSNASRPQQVIEVSLSAVPLHAHYLIFALCSRFGLESMVNPRVALSDSMGNKYASYSPSLTKPASHGVQHGDVGGAVVLCAAIRDSNQGWTIVQCGSQCLGYVVGHRRKVQRSQYAPIKVEIKRLLRGFLQMEGAAPASHNEPGAGRFNSMGKGNMAMAFNASSSTRLGFESSSSAARQYLRDIQLRNSTAEMHSGAQASGRDSACSFQTSQVVHAPGVHAMSSARESSDSVDSPQVKTSRLAEGEGEVLDKVLAENVASESQVEPQKGLSLLENVLLGSPGLDDKGILWSSDAVKATTSDRSVGSAESLASDRHSPPMGQSTKPQLSRAHQNATVTGAAIFAERRGDSTSLQNQPVQLEKGTLSDDKVPPALSQRLRCLSPRRHALVSLVVQELCAVQPSRSITIRTLNNTQSIRDQVRLIMQSSASDRAGIGISLLGGFMPMFFSKLPDIFSVTINVQGLRQVQLSPEFSDA